MTEINAYEKHIDDLISQYKKQLDSIKRTRDDVTSSSIVEYNYDETNNKIKLEEDNKYSHKNYEESDESVFELKKKIDYLSKENNLLLIKNSKLKAEIKHADQFTEQNQLYLKEIEMLRNENSILKVDRESISAIEKDMKILYEQHQTEISIKNSEIENLKHEINTIIEESQVRDKIVESLINFLNRMIELVNIKEKEGLFINLNSPINFNHIEGSISVVEMNVLQLKSLDKNEEELILLRNKLNDYDEEINQLRKENSVLLKDNNYYSNKLRNFQNIERVNTSERSLTPTKPYLFNNFQKENRDSLKTDYLEIDTSKFSIEKNIERKERLIQDKQTNKFNSFHDKFPNSTPLDSIKTKLKDIEKKLSSIKDNKERSIIDSLRDFRNNNIQNILSPTKQSKKEFA